jgi:AcrR family transcriptional regulator
MVTVLAGGRFQGSERQHERKQNILSAAREALAEKGYDGVTMNALAEKAGVVKKTLYNLYGSKDELLLAAISEVIEGYRGEAARAEAGIPAILSNRVAANQRIVETPAYAEAMTKALVQAPPDHPLVRVLLWDSDAMLTGHLETAAIRGELVPGVDIPALADQLAAQGWGTIVLWMKGLIPLADFEARSVNGLLVLLLGVTRGARREALAEMMNRMNQAGTQRTDVEG